jgi:transcription termination factor Rho
MRQGRGFRRGTQGWNNNRGNGGSWRRNWRSNGSSSNWRQDNTFRPVQLVDRGIDGIDSSNTVDRDDRSSNNLILSRSPSRERGSDRSGGSSGRSSRSSRSGRTSRSSKSSKSDNSDIWELSKDIMNQEN